MPAAPLTRFQGPQISNPHITMRRDPRFPRGGSEDELDMPRPRVPAQQPRSRTPRASDFGTTPRAGERPRDFTDSRDMRVAQAMEDGTFSGIREDFNQRSVGRRMDDLGNIREIDTDTLREVQEYARANPNDPEGYAALSRLWASIGDEPRALAAAQMQEAAQLRALQEMRELETQEAEGMAMEDPRRVRARQFVVELEDQAEQISTERENILENINGFVAEDPRVQDQISQARTEIEAGRASNRTIAFWDDRVAKTYRRAVRRYERMDPEERPGDWETRAVIEAMSSNPEWGRQFEEATQQAIEALEARLQGLSRQEHEILQETRRVARENLLSPSEIQLHREWLTEFTSLSDEEIEEALSTPQGTPETQGEPEDLIEDDTPPPPRRQDVVTQMM